MLNRTSHGTTDVNWASRLDARWRQGHDFIFVATACMAKSAAIQT